MHFLSLFQDICKTSGDIVDLVKIWGKCHVIYTEFGLL